MTQDIARPAVSADARTRLVGRSLALFANFFFIILAYYQVKAASRSLLIEFGGAAALPYAWVYSAAALTLLIGVYHMLVERYTRVMVVLGSLLAFAALLVWFRLFASPHGKFGAILFYVFVDIFSVVLVEQFWSLTDAVSNTEQGRRSYWFVGTGGLVGGVLGGLLASALLLYTPLETPDLLYACAALLGVVFALNVALWRAGLYDEIHDAGYAPDAAGGWRALLKSRYLMLIAGVLCFSQLAQPVVEYQFLDAVAVAYPDLDARTAFISEFFSAMGAVSILINLAVTPLVHRAFGAIGGLVVQPVVLGVCSVTFAFTPTLPMAAVMKIGDRGLSYSINRASKELLYIPIDPVLTYQAKAWIDMFGYRLFKAVGSGLIIMVTAWYAHAELATGLSWLTVALCALWVLCIAELAQAYRTVLAAA